MEDKWRLVAITAVAPIAWGATYVVTRHLLPPDAPLWGAALRALPAGLLLWAIARRRPRGSWWWRAPVLGLLNFGAFFVLVYLAAQLLPSSIAASIMALAPLALAGIAWPLLSQRPTARWAAGAVLGIVGVLLVVGLGAGAVSPAGVVASVIALLASSLGAILTTRWRDDTPLLATTSWQLIAGGIALVVAAAIVEGPPPRVDAIGVAAYAGIAVVATALAFVCWFTGLRHLPAGTVGIIGLLNPVTGVVLGVLVGGESLAPLQALGIALVLVSLVVARSRVTPTSPRRASSSPPQPSAERAGDERSLAARERDAP
ncbi:EamA family transporter [Microbacterium testaceum]|uniref:DMT family transporter n=1 Tax=Microbacterium testaceum TaxID=2033 RepID=UPI003434FD8F